MTQFAKTRFEHHICLTTRGPLARAPCPGLFFFKCYYAVKVRRWPRAAAGLGKKSSFFRSPRGPGPGGRVAQRMVMAQRGMWLTGFFPFPHSGAGVCPDHHHCRGGHGDGRGHRLPAESLQSLHPVLHQPPESEQKTGGRAAAGKCGPEPLPLRAAQASVPGSRHEAGYQQGPQSRLPS